MAAYRSIRIALLLGFAAAAGMAGEAAAPRSDEYVTPKSRFPGVKYDIVSRPPEGGEYDPESAGNARELIGRVNSIVRTDNSCVPRRNPFGYQYEIALKIGDEIIYVIASNGDESKKEIKTDAGPEPMPSDSLWINVTGRDGNNTGTYYDCNADGRPEIGDQDPYKNTVTKLLKSLRERCPAASTSSAPQSQPAKK